MASNTDFDITVPSGTSAVSDGDNTMRSMKSFSKAWWEQEHYATDGSSNSAGVHKPGSARIYRQSAAPTAVNIGELWHDPDDDSLYVAEAAGTGSWQLLTNSLSLGANTWTGKQTFDADIKITGAVDNILSGSVTRDIGSIAAQAFDTFNITVTGATVGSPVIIGFETLPSSHMQVSANVTATNTVSVTVKNDGIASMNPINQEYTATVFNKSA